MNKAERKARARAAMRGPIVNRPPAPEPPPPQKSRAKRIYEAIVVGVLGLIVAAGYAAWELLVHTRSSDRVLAVVTLDDGALLAIDEITNTWNRHDETIDQRAPHERVSYRLRRYQAASGKELALREVDGAPECIAAVAGRAWCRWDKQGRVHLLDERLQSVGGPVGDRVQVERLETDRGGALLVMGMDGVPSRIDPRTRQALAGDAVGPPRTSKGLVLSSVSAGKAMFELSAVKGQKRAAIHRVHGMSSKLLEPKHTYLADGFLGDAEGRALPVEDALFLVHRDTIAADAPRKLTRLTHAARPLFTVALPEAVESASLQGEVLVLVGRTRSIGIAVADGATRWSTPHR